MRRYLLLALAVGLLLVPGCLKRKDIQVPSHDMRQLFGSWQMIQITAGETGAIQTPQTLGYNISIEYKKDGTYYRYRNGSLELADEFTFEYSEQPHAVLGSHYILNSKNSFSNWVHIGNDTLYLDGARCGDCGSSVYIRK